MDIISRLLRKNLSRTQIAGFILSNFIGLAIVVAGIQLYCDLSPIWQNDDSFIRTDYLIVNKRVTASNTMGEDPGFTDTELSELRSQPWVRSIAPFTAADYKVTATVGGAHALSTYMFFEAVPDSLLDINPTDWHFEPSVPTVPIIISKDYLTLYNFGFASSAGLPRVSEQIMGSIPMTVRLSDEQNNRSTQMQGRIVGFSNRLNTILVPESFMKWSNASFGSGRTLPPSRLIIDVSSPGDVAIDRYLDDHGLEVAGDKSASQATFLLNIIMGIVMAIGTIITVLSIFILMLSISLLMQKNRDKLHSLLQLGYPLEAVGAPYIRLVGLSCATALGLALTATWIFRLFYLGSVSALGGGTGGLWLAPLCGVALTAVVCVCNIASVRAKVREAWRL